MEKIKISCFGISCRVAIGNLDDVIKKSLAAAAFKFQSPLDQAIFNEDFFELLKLEGYKSWLDLGNTTQVFGLLDSYQSFLEVRINGRKKIKILSTDLSNESFLFPIYTSINKQTHAQEKTNLIIVEKEIGNIATYIFEVPSFKISDLNFVLNSVSVQPEITYKILTEISYSGKELKSKKSDTLIKERFALFL